MYIEGIHDYFVGGGVASFFVSVTGCATGCSGTTGVFPGITLGCHVERTLPRKGVAPAAFDLEGSILLRRRIYPHYFLGGGSGFLSLGTVRIRQKGLARVRIGLVTGLAMVVGTTVGALEKSIYSVPQEEL